jgi:hypothetical protein
MSGTGTVLLTAGESEQLRRLAGKISLLANACFHLGSRKKHPSRRSALGILVGIGVLYAL